ELERVDVAIRVDVRLVVRRANHAIERLDAEQRHRLARMHDRACVRASAEAALVGDLAVARQVLVPRRVEVRAVLKRAGGRRIRLGRGLVRVLALLAVDVRVEVAHAPTLRRERTRADFGDQAEKAGALFVRRRVEDIRHVAGLETDLWVDRSSLANLDAIALNDRDGRDDRDGVERVERLRTVITGEGHAGDNETRQYYQPLHRQTRSG